MKKRCNADGRSRLLACNALRNVAHGAVQLCDFPNDPLDEQTGPWRRSTAVPGVPCAERHVFAEGVLGVPPNV